MENNSSFEVKFINPQEIIDQLDFDAGMKVADFGCGTGYFSLPIAKKIAKEGSVFSLDILPQKLESVLSQAKNSSLTNIIAQRANLEKKGGSKLGDNSMDWVILKDMLFQNKNKKIILEEAGRVLKEKGKLLVIEWKPEDTSIGPDQKLRISEEALVSLAQESGLGVFKKINAGNFHYGVILIK